MIEYARVQRVNLLWLRENDPERYHAFKCVVLNERVSDECYAFLALFEHRRMRTSVS